MLTNSPLQVKEPLFSGVPFEPTNNVLMISNFANAFVVQTSVGLLLIDSGTELFADALHDAVRAWSNRPLHTAVYTHGHVDHVGGLPTFLRKDAANSVGVVVVAHENVVRRFNRYRLTNGLNATINNRQFALPPNTPFMSSFVEPTLLFRDGLVQKIGDTVVEYRAAKGETDDACFVWLPERRLLFCGDLIIWRSPNAGNPQKVQRYPIEWAAALEEMAALNAEFLFPGHGPAVQGRDAVRLVLLETAQYLRHIINQVIPLLNAGRPADEIVEMVDSDENLRQRPYLRELYDHPKFITRNLIRQFGGWWNGRADSLLPAPGAALAREIATLAPDGVDALIARSRTLMASGDLALASHLAEFAVRAAPTNRTAQCLKRDVYLARLAVERNVMIAGIFRAAANEALKQLGEKPVKLGIEGARM